MYPNGVHMHGAQHERDFYTRVAACFFSLRSRVSMGSRVSLCARGVRAFRRYNCRIPALLFSQASIPHG